MLPYLWGCCICGASSGAAEASTWLCGALRAECSAGADSAAGAAVKNLERRRERGAAVVGG